MITEERLEEIRQMSIANIIEAIHSHNHTAEHEQGFVLINRPDGSSFATMTYRIGLVEIEKELSDS